MKYELWMASLTGINSRKKIAAKQMCGSAEAFFRQSKQADERMHIFSAQEIQLLSESRKCADPDYAWERFCKSGVSFTAFGHPGYPEKLAQIYQPPYALFYLGELPGEERCVAVVGARMCSEYGRSVATMLGRELAAGGVAVISGMALGIDSASHAGALTAGGRTYAVLGCGCDVCYPKTAANLYQNIQKSGGVLSEYPPGEKPLPYRFPERNRIISALSDLVVVVEAREKSGSLITADCALDQGKDVYAVPGRYGDALSAGCCRLISQGAGILYDINKFMEETGILNKKNRKCETSVQNTLEKEELLVYSCLDLHPKYVNNIIEETGLHVLDALHILENLKKRRIVQETFQNYYCRCL